MFSARRRRLVSQILIGNSADDAMSGEKEEVKEVISGHQVVPPATCSMETMGSMKEVILK